MKMEHEDWGMEREDLLECSECGEPLEAVPDEELPLCPMCDDEDVEGKE